MNYNFPDHINHDTFEGVSFTVLVNTVALNLTGASIRMMLRSQKLSDTAVLTLTSVMFDLDSYAGIGCGAYNIPLWGIDLYPGENIDFIPIPYVADQSVWGLTIAGTESALGTGTTGPTSWAY